MHCICYRVAFGSYESLAHRSRFALTLARETEPGSAISPRSAISLLNSRDLPTCYLAGVAETQLSLPILATPVAFGSTSYVGGRGSSEASTGSSDGEEEYEGSRDLFFGGSTFIRDGERWRQGARRFACSDTTGGGGFSPRPLI